MKLYLVQHGEAVAKEVDAERPLTAQGKAAVEQMAQMLVDAEVSPTRVIHSGKLRAQQTADILGAALTPTEKPEISDQINPNDDPATFDLPATDALLVGHLPFMARLVAWLVIGNSDATIVAYTPGSVVCLESNDKGGWQINWMLRPLPPK